MQFDNHKSGSIRFKVPSSLKSDLPGIEWLCELAEQSAMFVQEHVFIDFSQCDYIEGNLCAVLGSIIHGMQTKGGCTVYFSGHSESLKRMLANNSFWKSFQPDEVVDYVPNDDAVPFRWFREAEEKDFEHYITNKLFNKLVKLRLSEALRRRMIESIGEIYVNAHTHGRCDLVFCCGQFFRRSGMLSVTIVDLGRTIKANVEDFLLESQSGIKSIVWALTEPNSTKTNQSGGFGLKLTSAFIDFNLGKMHIVSSNGFWALETGVYYRHELPIAFPGTIVTLTFNLEDKAEYRLSEEAPTLSNPF